MTNRLYCGDLPEGLDFGPIVAVDTEAMGLNPHRDRLCLVQLSAGDGDAHLVQFAPGAYAAPRLRDLLADRGVTTVFVSLPHLAEPEDVLRLAPVAAAFA